MTRRFVRRCAACPAVFMDRPASGDIRIGISGWRYPPWRGRFYPKGLAQRRELEFASRSLPTIEVNGTFYSLQTPTSFATWRDETPEDFVFAVKGPRYVTHMLKLRHARVPLANFFASGPLALGSKLGPILWQLRSMEIRSSPGGPGRRIFEVGASIADITWLKRHRMRSRSSCASCWACKPEIGPPSWPRRRRPAERTPGDTGGGRR